MGESITSTAPVNSSNKKQERFGALQARWRKASDSLSDFNFRLRYKYGNHWSAPRREREKYEALQKREDKASDAIFNWLECHSPRQWRCGVPANWVCSELTYADAMTTGALSVIPPPCYGSYPGDAQRFAQPIVSSAAPSW